jgi:hypothetical protein
MSKLNDLRIGRIREIVGNEPDDRIAMRRIRAALGASEAGLDQPIPYTLTSLGLMAAQESVSAQVAAICRPMPQGASGGSGRTTTDERATVVARTGGIGGSGGGISPYEAVGTPGAGQGVAHGIAVSVGGSGPSHTERPVPVASFGGLGQPHVVDYEFVDDGSDGSDGEQP